MTLKYKITTIQNPDSTNLFQIRALRDIPRFNVKKGDVGGYVEHEGNLSQEGDCWIEDAALVYENARVFGNARVSGNTQIFGNAQVFDNARVYGDAWVGESALINENMEITGFSYIREMDQIYYSCGVTIFFYGDNMVINGTSPDIEHHKMLARLKLL